MEKGEAGGTHRGSRLGLEIRTPRVAKRENTHRTGVKKNNKIQVSQRVVYKDKTQGNTRID